MAPDSLEAKWQVTSQSGNLTNCQMLPHHWEPDASLMTGLWPKTWKKIFHQVSDSSAKECKAKTSHRAVQMQCGEFAAKYFKEIKSETNWKAHDTSNLFTHRTRWGPLDISGFQKFNFFRFFIFFTFGRRLKQTTCIRFLVTSSPSPLDISWCSKYGGEIKTGMTLLSTPERQYPEFVFN